MGPEIKLGEGVSEGRGPLGALDLRLNKNREAYWKTNAMRSSLHPLIADTIVGHGDGKKDVISLYATINDADLGREIDRLTFDHGKTEIWRQE